MLNVEIYCCMLEIFFVVWYGLRVSCGCFDGIFEGVIDNVYLLIWGVDVNKVLNFIYLLV